MYLLIIEHYYIEKRKIMPETSSENFLFDILTGVGEIQLTRPYFKYLNKSQNPYSVHLYLYLIIFPRTKKKNYNRLTNDFHLF